MDEPGKATIGRRRVLGLAAAATASATLAPPVAAAAHSGAASDSAPDAPRDGSRGRPHGDLSSGLLEQWRQVPQAHPLLGDFRNAGYRLGARLPRRPGRTSVRGFGAVGDGRTDDVEAFNAAVRAVGERGGGTVLVPPGTYLLSEPVWMHWSNVVLCGAGSRRTVLHFSRPLDEGYRPNPQIGRNQNRWSWAGGQIWLIPQQRLRLLEDEGWTGTEGWLLGDTLADVAVASRGQRTLVVSDARSLQPGQMVVLESDNPPDASLLQHLAGDTDGARAYDWLNTAPQLVTGSGGQFPQYATLQWPVRIEAVLGERLVQLAQPLKYDLRPGWPSRLRAIGPVVTESGVERLTIRNELIPQTVHNLNPGSNGVHVQVAHDCWADDVRVENCDVGFGLTSAKSVTFSNVTIAGRAPHHPFVCRMQSHDNLVQDFEVEPFTVPLVEGAYLHGINVEGLSSGNVYSRGRMAEGTFDSHRALPFENARTDITISNSGIVGGSPTSGPYFGARIAHWNVRITNGRPYAVPIGDVAPRSVSVGIQGLTDTSSGLQPDYTGDLESVSDFSVPSVENLHEAQRRARP